MMMNETPPIKYSVIFSSFIDPPKFQFTYSPELKNKIVQVATESSIYGKDYSTSIASEPVESSEKFISLHACDKLLSFFIKSPDFASFRNPIDPKKSGWEHYYEVVKEPMDLTTLQRKLRNGSVNTISEFRRCLSLIWINAETYHGPGHAITRCSMTLKKDAEEFFAKLPMPAEFNVIEKLKKMDENMTKVEAIFDNLFKIPPRPKIDKPKEAKPQPRQAKVVEQKVVVTKPTQTELKRIAYTLANTPASDMKAVWELLYNNRGDKVELNLNDLPEKIQIELKRLVLK
ncbi:Bromodomain containing protein [Trichomonas vaginalis G3]|uniref:Bromodomain containing protein n=1 Tax=Trichomonas vaginalis (strain ATCC PRA-98 / G3) TaxID=412133 RepID=A2DDB1_TRIV3|nr:acetylation-dependent protein binding [Trichomonas vaginalis G3]EAY21590.1 Bromodomain containing protein [Trichomonas vaginalis G3]KAI5489734.1 acetylation-dependent protein binding [Trichomonas vaginalis G3]|eukprot:XP_001582576.1 Bromodomain containing protein [Trichomonas vaginalis G3]